MHATPETPETASERLFVIGGTAIAIAGMLKRSTVGGLGLMLLGGALVARGLQTRQHNWDVAHGCVEPEIPDTHGLVIEHTMIIDLPRPQVYAFWRNFEGLPRFVSRLESVKELEEGKSSWVAKAPNGATLTWDAEIVAEAPEELISWRSLPGAVLRNEGAVYFYSVPGDRTEMRIYMELHPPLGSLGLKAAHMTGEDPEALILADLQEFKRNLEEHANSGFIGVVR